MAVCAHGRWLSSKVLLVMKLSALLILFALVHASAKSYSQISLYEKNAPLEKVLKQIKQQTGYTFFYDSKDVKDAKVSIRVSDASLDQALSICFRDIPISFKVIENSVVLKKKDESALTKLLDYITLPVNIGGIVSDEGGPLAGVSVAVKRKGTDKASFSTMTNAQGRFRLANVNEDDIVVFSFIGYKTQEVIVKNTRDFSIKLEKDVAGLEQVVVLGYGSTRKKDLTGSVSTVQAKDIEDIPFNTLDNAIAGKAAGVSVTKTDGTPGGAVRIRIRGSSSLLGGNNPLYVVDGVPVQVSSNFVAPGFDVSNPVGNDVMGSNRGSSSGMATAFVNGLNSLGGLNVDDIESITILKDASSTAIYGSKAANGVVIITTKKGRKDMAPQITASYYATASTPVNPDVLDAAQYKMLLTEAARNDYNELTAAGAAVPNNVNLILNNPSFFGSANTDWIKEVTRNTVSHNAEVSVTGGGDKSRYFNSISYNSIPGVVISTDYQRVSGKLNLENEISNHFKFVTNMLLGYTNQKIGNGAYGQALRARPDYSPYDETGNFTDFSAVAPSYEGFQNPVALSTAINNAKMFSLVGSVSGIYNFTKYLEFKSTASLNMQTYNQRNFTPSYLQIGSFYGNVANDGGIGSNTNSRFADWFIENTLSYNKIFNEKHSVDLLAGTSYETTKNSFFSATASGFPNDNVLTSLSSAVNPLFQRGDDPSKPQSYLLSFYLRANYGFADKYLLTFTGRADGSSKFGPDNKFGYFPSGAVAWRLSKENFLKDVSWISDIKLRGSYGLTGTQNIGDQMYRSLYSPYSYAGQSALIPTQLGNEAIKWESTKEADAGLDISLFNNRLQAVFDYYNKRTSGALLSLPVAPSSSYSSLLRNAASIKNTGYEIALQGDIIKGRNFRWNASANVTWNKSLVTKLDSKADLSQIGNLTGLEYGNTTLVEGKPLGLITGLTVKGLIRNQEDLDNYKNQLGVYATYFFPYLNIGDPMFQLENTGPTDNFIDFNTIIASAAPKYFGGFTQGFSYKKLNLQMYFTFSQGGKLVWGDHASSVAFVGTANANTAMLNRYTPGNTGTNEPRLILNEGLYYKSNLDVFSSSYIKLRTLSLNYQLDKAPWVTRAGLKNVSLFASATNLFTITKYPGNDPETSDDPYSVNGGYFDVSNYPVVRTFSLGAKVNF